MMIGGLTVVLLGVATYVGALNECVAIDVRARPFYAVVPGLDLLILPVPQRDRLVKELNARYCTRQCMMKLASCRNNHSSCRTSLTMSRAILAKLAR